MRVTRCLMRLNVAVLALVVLSRADVNVQAQPRSLTLASNCELPSIAIALSTESAVEIAAPNRRSMAVRTSRPVRVPSQWRRALSIRTS